MNVNLFSLATAQLLGLNYFDHYTELLNPGNPYVCEAKKVPMTDMQADQSMNSKPLTPPKRRDPKSKPPQARQKLLHVDADSPPVPTK